MGWYFVPDDWEISPALMKWTKDKGLTDKQIADLEERFRDHQYKRPMKRADACWRNWVRNSIEWGHVVPVQETRHRQVQEVSEEQRQKDIEKFHEEMKKFKVVK
jgi:hypothetical protein